MVSLLTILHVRIGHDLNTNMEMSTYINEWVYEHTESAMLVMLMKKRVWMHIMVGQNNMLDNDRAVYPLVCRSIAECRDTQENKYENIHVGLCVSRPVDRLGI